MTKLTSVTLSHNQQLEITNFMAGDAESPHYSAVKINKWNDEWIKNLWQHNNEASPYE